MRPTEMIVLFLHGPAAAGKYSIGSELSNLLGWPLFHNHLAVDAALSLFEFGTAEFRSLRTEIWRAAFTEATKANCSFIFTFHPEATVPPDLVQKLVSIVEKGGGKVLFVEIQCSTREILSRLGNESRYRFRKLTDQALYMKVEREGGFDFPRLPTPVITIDTEKTGVKAAAKQIEAAIRGCA